MLEFIALAQQCAPAIEPRTMAAIVKHESGFKPNAIGINRGGRLQWQPRDKTEAVVTATWLIEQGYNIDMGLGQINSANLRRLGLTVNDVFDPCTNLRAAARILGDNLSLASKSQTDPQKRLHVALSYYNTGSPTRGFNNGYVRKVMANMAPGQPAAGVGTLPAVTPIPLARSGAKGKPMPQAKRAMPMVGLPVMEAQAPAPQQPAPSRSEAFVF